MIYKTFKEWKDGNYLEDLEPRKEAYTRDELLLVEMGWKYGFDAGVEAGRKDENEACEDDRRDAERYRFMRQNIDWEIYGAGDFGAYFYNNQGELDFELDADNSKPSFESVLDAAIRARREQ